MVAIITAIEQQHSEQIRELFWEYLQWANARVNEEFGVNFDIAAIIADDMHHLDKFMPPAGRLLLGYSQESLAGIACLKKLTADTGEIKRMYVRPEQRGQGLGRALIGGLLEAAREIGYQRLRLDSARFMKEAHQLYKSVGFGEIAPYEGSEIPEGFRKHWVFMELHLHGTAGRKRAGSNRV